MGIKFSEILNKVLNEEELKEIEEQINVPKMALGKEEQVKILEIKATPTALGISDNLTNNTKTYAVVGNRYNIKKEMFNKDFDVNVDDINWKKIENEINTLLTKFPNKAVSLTIPQNDIKIVLKRNPNGIDEVKEINIIEPIEKETPK